MSYILEALKRADAERERGGVPTLHSHALPSPSPAAARPLIANWMAAAAALIAVLLAVGWWTMGRQGAPVQLAVPKATPQTVPLAVAPTPLPSLPSLPSPPPVASVAPAPRPAPPATAKPLPQKAAPPAPAVADRKSAEPAPRVAASKPAASAMATATTPDATAQAALAPAKPASAPKALVFAMADLPDDVRQQLPKLAISGATYSAQAAYRMLIVNGQVLHESDEPAPGLVLETIREKDAVWRFKGYRYSMGY